SGQRTDEELLERHHSWTSSLHAGHSLHGPGGGLAAPRKVVCRSAVWASIHGTGRKIRARPRTRRQGNRSERLAERGWPVTHEVNLRIHREPVADALFGQ